MQLKMNESGEKNNGKDDGDVWLKQAKSALSGHKKRKFEDQKYNGVWGTMISINNPLYSEFFNDLNDFKAVLREMKNLSAFAFIVPDWHIRIGASQEEISRFEPGKSILSVRNMARENYTSRIGFLKLAIANEKYVIETQKIHMPRFSRGREDLRIPDIVNSQISTGSDNFVYDSQLTKRASPSGGFTTESEVVGEVRQLAKIFADTFKNTIDQITGLHNKITQETHEAIGTEITLVK